MAFRTIILVHANYLLLSPCRVLASVIKCLHGHKMQIQEECRKDGADEYHNNYIRPLLDQVSGRIKKRCHMSPPYDQYVGAAMSDHVTSLVTWSTLVTCLIVLLQLL